MSPPVGTLFQIFVVFTWSCILILRWRCYSTQRQGDYAAITSEGIRFRQYEMLEPDLIHWKDIEGFETGRICRVCRIIHRIDLFDDEESDDQELVGMFDTKDDVRAFAEHARARWSLVHEAKAGQDMEEVGRALPDTIGELERGVEDDSVED